MSLFARLLSFRPAPPRPCSACAKVKIVAVGIEVCRHDPERPRFCDDFRHRPQAFGGCGVKARFFEPREPQS